MATSTPILRTSSAWSSTASRRSSSASGMALPFMPAMAHAGHAGDGHHAGEHGLVAVEVGEPIDHALVVVDGEEELGDREVGPRAWRREAAVARDPASVGGSRGGPPRPPRRHRRSWTCATSSRRARSRHRGRCRRQGGSPPRARMFSMPCAASGRAAPRCRRGVADAGEVRHGWERLLRVDARDRIAGALPAAAEGAVGDRHERRLQLGELRHRLLQLTLHLVVLRGKNSKDSVRPVSRRSLIRSWGVQRYEAAPSTHQIPMPAVCALPPARERRDHIFGRQVDRVSPPLLFTHTTTPSGASTWSTSVGNEEGVHEHDAVGRRSATEAGRRRPEDARRRSARGGSI